MTRRVAAGLFLNITNTFSLSLTITLSTQSVVLELYILVNCENKSTLFILLLVISNIKFVNGKIKCRKSVKINVGFPTFLINVTITIEVIVNMNMENENKLRYNEHEEDPEIVKCKVVE